MTGYQEILTDPSYSRQIVTLTYPHIGNVGTNASDEESSAVHAQGLVIRDLPLIASNYRNEEGLSEYLKRHNIVAIADIDTRKLTRLLREKEHRTAALLLGSCLTRPGIGKSESISRLERDGSGERSDHQRDVSVAARQLDAGR